MTARELIEKLEKVNPDSRIFMGYDGNIVVTEAFEVEEILAEKQVGECWWSVKPGHTVILCAE